MNDRKDCTSIGLLQQTVTWYKVHHAGGQMIVTAFKTKRFQPVKLEFFCLFFFFVPAHSLPSSMADFVPCDCPLQKTYYTDFQIPFVPRPLFKRSQQISYLFLLIAETLTILY